MYCRRRFTLIELIVVLSLLAVLIAGSAASIAQIDSPKQRLRREVVTLTQFVSDARRMAMSHKRHIHIHADNGTLRAAFAVDTSDTTSEDDLLLESEDEEEAPLLTITLDETIALELQESAEVDTDEPEARLTITPLGLVQGKQLRLSCNDIRIAIGFDPLTGVGRIEAPEDEVDE